MTTTVYYGPPGTGKTATLLGCVREHLAAGVPPSRIAALSFSRRAALELRGRAATELGLDGDDLEHWSTLHSAAARQLGAGGRLLGPEHWAELGELLGVPLRPTDDEGRPLETALADQGGALQAVLGLARARLLPLGAAWERFGRRRVPWATLDRFARTLTAYKAARGLLDFADLLDQAPGGLPVDVALLDEAQDLTPAQWAYAHRAIAGARHVYVAGDDDQALYDWAGGDVRELLALPADARVVLDRSHRVPAAVYDLATRLTDRIVVRQPKTWSCRGGSSGAVERVGHLERVPVGEGRWLLLARTRRLADRWEARCRAEGVTYLRGDVSSVRPEEGRAVRAWETLRRGGEVRGGDLALAARAAKRKLLHEVEPDELYDLTALGVGDLAELPVWHEALTTIPAARRRYYEACLRRSPRALVDPPRVIVSTVHGAKGAEADQVALLPDLTPRVEEGLRADPDAEHRVWYVAATRARERLVLVRPDSLRSYDI